MKKILLFAAILLSLKASAQNKNISFIAKSFDPVIIGKDTFAVDKEIKLQMGTGINGTFSYIKLLSLFNEPLDQAGSDAAYKKQKIRFFKTSDGTTYLFTKYFVVNIEPAIASKEIVLLK